MKLTNALLPFAATIVGRSLRFRWKGVKLPERCVVLFWHEDMFCGWWLQRKHRPLALVSASKDGQILAKVLTYWGYELARGSSSSGGKQALQAAIDKMSASKSGRLAITPDGPRGPRRILKRGGFAAANALELPLYFLTFDYSSAKRLTKSWDHFAIPLPFSKVTVTAQRLSTEGFPESKEEQLQWLENFQSSVLEWVI